MGIQEDAGELLAYIYEQYISDRGKIKPEDIIYETKRDASRINRAKTYLADSNLIEIVSLAGNTEGVHNFLIVGLMPSGIETIENKKKFVSTFGFEIGVPGVFKFSWKGERRGRK